MGTLVNTGISDAGAVNVDVATTTLGSVRVQHFLVADPTTGTTFKPASEATISSLDGKTPALGQATMAGSQPVVIASNQSAIPVSLSTLPLPTGAATEATLAAASAKLITGGPQLGSGIMTATTQRVTLATDGPEVTNSTAIKISVASIDGKTPSLGQSTMAGSQPVVIASNQSAIPVSLSTSPLPTGAATEATLAAASAKLIAGGPQLGGGIMTATTQRVTLATDGPEVTNSTAIKNSTASMDGKMPALVSGRQPVDGSGVTQPVSAASLPLPAGAATATGVAAIVTALGTPAQAGATQAISAASLPLPTGAATETTLAAINTKIPSQGQATMAASHPVVIASNQSNLPANITQVGGVALALGTQAASVSLPVNLSNDPTVGAAASIAAINVDLLTNVVSGWYDAANFHSAAIQVIGSASITAGAIFFEQTNDITNAAAGNVWPVEEMTGLTPTPNIAAITIAASTIRMFCGPIIARYVRVRVSTAFATANVQAVGVFSQLPYVRPVQTVHQATAANLNVTAALAATQTLTTVTTVGTVTTLANGQTAHSAASTGSPVRVGGRVITTLDTTLVQGDASDAAITTGQQLVTKDFASSENDWQYAAAASGILNTTVAVTIKAAGAAGIRNFITNIDIEWEALGSATEFVIRDGAAGVVIYRTKLGTAAGRKTVSFPTPLRGTAATLLEIATLTASVTGAVYFNAQGFQSA